MSEIAFTKVKLPYGWLGNMASFPIYYNGENYLTTEALFQALRFTKSPEIQEKIRMEKSPMSAKMVAKSYTEQMDHGILYSDKDIENMKLCLEIKLNQYPELKEQLIATGEDIIIEDCSKRPHGSGLFWGAEKTENGWNGKNILGVLWMEKREELIKSLENKEIFYYYGFSGELNKKIKTPLYMYVEKDDAKEFANNYTDLKESPHVAEIIVKSDKVLDLTNDIDLNKFNNILNKLGLIINKDQFDCEYKTLDGLEIEENSLDVFENKNVITTLKKEFDLIKTISMLNNKKVISIVVLNNKILKLKKILDIDVDGNIFK